MNAAFGALYDADLNDRLAGDDAQMQLCANVSH